jgi:hypothetical protein
LNQEFYRQKVSPCLGDFSDWDQFNLGDKLKKKKEKKKEDINPIEFCLSKGLTFDPLLHSLILKAQKRKKGAFFFPSIGMHQRIHLNSIFFSRDPMGLLFWVKKAFRELLLFVSWVPSAHHQTKQISLGI